MMWALILLLLAPLAELASNNGVAQEYGSGLMTTEECPTPSPAVLGAGVASQRRRRYAGAGLGESCTNSPECSVVENAHCHMCNCTCRPGFYTFNTTTCSPANSTLTNVSATALTSSIVHVTWKGQAQVGYRLEWGAAGGEVRCFRHLATNQSSANITGLDPNTPYSIQVSAENRDSFNNTVTSTLETTVVTLMEDTSTSMMPSSPSSSPSSTTSYSTSSSTSFSPSPSTSPSPLGTGALVGGADLRDTKDPVTATWWVLLALVIALTFALILALICRRKKKKKKANSIGDRTASAEDAVTA